jgi:GGDEF domain-containing protein
MPTAISTDALSNYVEHCLGSTRQTGLAIINVHVSSVASEAKTNPDIAFDITEQAVARVCEIWDAVLRPSDQLFQLTTARLGIVRSPLASAVDAETLADRLIARCTDPLRLGTVRVRARVHVGLAISQPHHQGTHLISIATAALERAVTANERDWLRVDS